MCKQIVLNKDTLNKIAHYVLTLRDYKVIVGARIDRVECTLENTVAEFPAAYG